MKKVFLISILTFFAIHSYAQYVITKDFAINQSLIIKLDSMGIDDNWSLNKYEIEYFNAKFQKERQDFDFTDKRIAFFSSSGGGVRRDKKDYFSTEKDRCLRDYSSNQASLIIFNEQQKQDSGGYDAVIYYWSKILRNTQYYVKKLKKGAKNNSSNSPTN